MKKYKVALTQALSDEGMAYLEQYMEPYVVDSSDWKTLLAALPGKAALISRGGALPREFFVQAAQLGLKVVGKTSAGVDTVDLAAATEYGIPVVFCPGANARSVAEYTVAAILAANKEFAWSNSEMHRNNRRYREEYLGTHFEGCTVLLLGFGNIGKLVADMCRALSMHVIVFDKYIDRETVENAGFEYTDNFKKVLHKADFLSVHMPLTDETRGMIGAEELDAMKDGACIINTARGGIINEAALVNHIHSGKIKGAVMDVIEGEPEIKQSPLLECDRVMLSGHIAGQTREALYATAKTCVDGILAVLRGEKWDKIANPAIYQNRII